MRISRLISFAAYFMGGFVFKRLPLRGNGVLIKKIFSPIEDRITMRLAKCIWMATAAVCVVILALASFLRLKAGVPPAQPADTTQFILCSGTLFGGTWLVCVFSASFFTPLKGLSVLENYLVATSKEERATCEASRWFFNLFTLVQSDEESYFQRVNAINDLISRYNFPGDDVPPEMTQNARLYQRYEQALRDGTLSFTDYDDSFGTYRFSDTAMLAILVTTAAGASILTASLLTHML